MKSSMDKLGFRFKVFWVLGILFVLFGVFYSLKYTSTSRPVPKIKLSFSQDLQEIGRYNYLRLWPELEEHPIVLGLNQHMAVEPQLQIWLGFLSEAQQRGKDYRVTIDRNVVSILPAVKNFPKNYEVVKGLESWLQQPSQDRRVLITFSKKAAVEADGEIKKLRVLSLWPLAPDRRTLEGESWPYRCVQNLKSVDCEIKYRAISTFRKLKRKKDRKLSKNKPSSGWFYITDHINRSRYNIYLYKN